MSLFRKKADRTDVRTAMEQGGSSQFRHLERVVQAGKAVAREPNMKAQGTTVTFLPYPDFEAADPPRAAQPDRDPGTGDYGDFLFPAEGVRWFGKNGVTLLFDNPDDSGFNVYDDHPIYLMRDAAYRAVMKDRQIVDTPFGSSVDDKWGLLLNGSGNDPNAPADGKMFAALTRPERLLIGYVYIFAMGEAVIDGPPLGSADGDLPVVFVMTQNTGRTLLGEFDKATEGRQPVTGAKYVHFYNRKTGNCPAMINAHKAAQAAAGGFGGRRGPAAASAAGDKNQLAGYGVHLSDTMSGLPGEAPLDRNAVVARALKQLRPWQETLRGHSPDECAKVVADHCGLPLSLQWWAWRRHKHWYSEELQYRLTNPVTREVRAPQPAAGPALTAAAAAPTPNPLTQPAAHAAPPVARDPGAAAPWGGHVTDARTAAAEESTFDLTEAGDDTDAGSGYDPEKLKQYRDKFREEMAKSGKLPFEPK